MIHVRNGGCYEMSANLLLPLKVLVNGAVIVFLKKVHLIFNLIRKPEESVLLD